LSKKDRNKKKEGRKEDKPRTERERNIESWNGGTTTQQAECVKKEVSNYRQKY